MLTSRLLGVPSALLALASLAPLSIARPDLSPTHGTGSGDIILPASALGAMRGTLLDAAGQPAYLLRAQLEAYHVFNPGSRLGSLEGRLFDPYTARLVGTLRGMWYEQDGEGTFHAQVHPVGVPDPHHFLAGHIRGRFELNNSLEVNEGGIASEEVAVEAPASAAVRAAAMRLKLRAQAMRDALMNQERTAPKIGLSVNPFTPPVPTMIKQAATAPIDGDAGRFQLDWVINGLL